MAIMASGKIATMLERTEHLRTRMDAHLTARADADEFKFYVENSEGKQVMVRARGTNVEDARKKVEGYYNVKRVISQVRGSDFGRDS